MGFRAVLCAVLFAYLSGHAQSSNGIVAIVGARVFAPDGSASITNVIIRGERIDSVGGEVPRGARSVNGAGHTLLPGLFDLHTHLSSSAVAGLNGDWGKNLAAYLYCGVTSVMDFGTYPETFEPMRRLVARGAIPAPRLSLAARMTTPGGHGAEGGRGEVFSLEVTTPREARAALKRLLAYKPDAIKVFTDGWRYGTGPDMTSMEEDTLSAIVEEAHRHQVEVLTHTVSLAKAKIAARAKVDVIAHGIGDEPADAELFKLMQENGTTYAPTLAVYEPRRLSTVPQLLHDVMEPAARNRIPLRAGAPASGPRARRWEILNQNTAALRKAGVTFGVGTDAGVTGAYHGWATLRELKLLVAGGLTPAEALLAATVNSARALHVDSDRGSIAPGMLADLVLVQGKPDENIQDIDQVRIVFLGGRELDRQDLARRIASGDVTPLPTVSAQPLIDDMERAERTSVETLRVYRTDSGHDHSRTVFVRTPREQGNHALTLIASMSEKDRPFVRLDLPLTLGGVEPADASRFTGIEFEARGDGNYRVLLESSRVRDWSDFEATFEAGSTWKVSRIPFSEFRQRMTPSFVSWSGKDLRIISFEIARPAGSKSWLELDNVKFYK